MMITISDEKEIEGLIQRHAEQIARIFSDGIPAIPEIIEAKSQRIGELAKALRDIRRQRSAAVAQRQANMQHLAEVGWMKS